MNYNSIKNKIFSENPAVKAEYDQLGPQYEAIRAAIASRKSAGLTQKQLAEKMGTAQANIGFSAKNGFLHGQDTSCFI